MKLHDFWYARHKSLILPIPPDDWGHAHNHAASLPNCTVLDWRQEVLQTVRPKQQRLRVSDQTEIERLSRWSEVYPRKLIAIVNTEYFLTKLNHRERDSFWRRLYRGTPHLSCIVVYVVLQIPELLPRNLDDWGAEDRLLSIST